MATNNFKPFATGTGANVMSQTDWEALAALTTGFQSGKASSAQVNKALRQSTVIASVVAQLIANRTGNDVLDNGDTAALLSGLSSALFNSPALTGTPTAPTATSATSTTQVATTAFVHAITDLLAPLASPVLTGTPTAPTAAIGTNTTQLATTAFVKNAFSSNSQAVSGYQILPSGLIIQWGQSAAGAASPVTVTFPITFPGACWNVIGTIYDDTNPASTTLRRRTSSTPLSSATFFLNNGTSFTSINWFAIGN